MINSTVSVYKGGDLIASKSDTGTATLYDNDGVVIIASINLSYKNSSISITVAKPTRVYGTELDNSVDEILQAGQTKKYRIEGVESNTCLYAALII